MGNQLNKRPVTHGTHVPMLNAQLCEPFPLPSGAVFLPMSPFAGDLPIHSIPQIVLNVGMESQTYQDCIYEINQVSIRLFSQIRTVVEHMKHNAALIDLYYQVLDQFIGIVESLCEKLNENSMKTYNLVLIPFVDILRDESNEQHFGIIIDYLNKDEINKKVKKITKRRIKSIKKHQNSKQSHLQKSQQSEGKSNDKQFQQEHLSLASATQNASISKSNSSPNTNRNNVNNDNSNDNGNTDNKCSLFACCKLAKQHRQQHRDRARGGVRNSISKTANRKVKDKDRDSDGNSNKDNTSSDHNSNKQKQHNKKNDNNNNNNNNNNNSNNNSGDEVRPPLLNPGSSSLNTDNETDTDSGIEHDRMSEKKSKRHKKHKKHVNNAEIVIITDTEEECKDGIQLTPLSIIRDPALSAGTQHISPALNLVPSVTAMSLGDQQNLQVSKSNDHDHDHHHAQMMYNCKSESSSSPSHSQRSATANGIGSNNKNFNVNYANPATSTLIIIDEYDNECSGVSQVEYDTNDTNDSNEDRKEKGVVHVNVNLTVRNTMNVNENENKNDDFEDNGDNDDNVDDDEISMGKSYTKSNGPKFGLKLYLPKDIRGGSQ